MADQAIRIKCPVCGADCPAEAKFCRNCGTKLEQKAFCKRCGGELAPGAEFCRNCGASVNDEETIQDNFADDAETIQEKDPQAEHSSGGAEKPEKGVSITLKPAVIAAGAAVLLFIAAAAFIIGNMSSGEKDIAAQPEVQEHSGEQTVPDEQENPVEPEIDMSLVDIDAVSNEYVELHGCVISNGYGLRLQMDAPLNFYVFDAQQSKDVLVQGVDQPYLASDSALSMTEYEGRVVTAGGEVRFADGNIVFRVDSIIYAEPEQDDPGIHQYQIVIEDCTWYEALTRCTAQGGYLARISSPEEYQHIVDLLNNGGYTNIHFYLGGRRDDAGTEYYWVNEQNEYIGDCLNSSDSWTGLYWYQNEPSFRDVGSDANGQIAENVMNLFCVSGTWYLNDSSDDLVGYYPDLLRGKVGYIIEYEE